ncbi:Flp family type IVb pilin [Devosia sp. PTR5]|jgi:pilus assembly protein Flp/PilA|uniref:Flp family type IVb pilin n=1 Tax=Devosia oryzisoli TaxID=2774138 RepID=A0A927FZQ3_9HYPH|nr:Flp family type IVb pilin [Devosia oryzisoli]MBD8067056.1 Flp family type IVb pilin [Devosia oryzisoli]
MRALPIRRFLRNESGATAVEYGLLAGLIAVALIASFIALGNTTQGLLAAGGAANVMTDQAATIP